METFGRYELLRRIAVGGMGAVYLARQKGPVGFQKLLVLKRLLPHLSEDDEFIQMFLDEGRIAAHLNHPHIAQIYDLGDVDGQYFIAMEYVHGEAVGPLGARAQQRKVVIPLGLKCRIIADAAAGLDAAHNARSPSGRKLALIHRDVSPQNVLVGFNGGVKIIDFGVAKASGKLSQTMVGTIKGKHAYMSPEQARGEPLDHRSDVYGLGTVFYELLTLTRLFKRDTELATLKAVVGAKILPPSEVVPEIPKALDAIVLKALARKREERFSTAGELQLALEEFLMQQKLHATATHLAAFMQDMYSEELEEERFAAEPTVIHYDPKLAARLAASAPQAGAKPARPGGGSSASAAPVKGAGGSSASAAPVPGRSVSSVSVAPVKAPGGSSASAAPVPGAQGRTVSSASAAPVPATHGRNVGSGSSAAGSPGPSSQARSAGGGSSASAAPVPASQAQGKSAAVSKSPAAAPGTKPAPAKSARPPAEEAPPPRRAPPRGGGHGEGER
ncbi:serine/threonine protein kinase [Pyxidicoccus sp. MSG2]|uniref:serine/threonine protein kinase n=1 Tax=Pyxidicoccus sp. MSG2 TaxID=2996790 RepID=UPI00227180F8|nr:serine/threonine protein kinase [Pyxidicoccus sp. MSG2]MCY1020423.1 protein kinase [Pyxidicoccus sp. MSG2]